MRKSSLSIHVYAELRAALGDAIPAGELLAMADRLIDAATRREVIDRCGRWDDACLDLRPIDVAIRDGGWSVLNAERADLWFDDEHADCAPMPGALQHHLNQLEAWA